MYDYKKERPKIFTEQGQIEFLKVRDRANQLLETSGAFKTFNALVDISGNSWTMMSYLDRLVELGEIVEITKGMEVSGQNRVFVAA